jgi:lipoprotein NlpI
MTPRPLVAFFYLAVCASVAFAAPKDVQLGVDAFKQGRYEAARDHFSTAYAAGNRSPTLLYNLGSTQFKLGDYAAAHDSFAHIANDPTWGALSLSNLGLIAERQHDADAAQLNFKAAYDAASSDKLRELAAMKLAKSPAEQTAKKKEPDWYGIVSLAAGYDDNVVLLNDQSLENVSHKQDYFGEALASASGFVRGDIDHGWRADFSGYYR